MQMQTSTSRSRQRRHHRLDGLRELRHSLSGPLPVRGDHVLSQIGDLAHQSMHDVRLASPKKFPRIQGPAAYSMNDALAGNPEATAHFAMEIIQDLQQPPLITVDIDGGSSNIEWEPPPMHQHHHRPQSHPQNAYNPSAISATVSLPVLGTLEPEFQHAISIMPHDLTGQEKEDLEKVEATFFSASVESTGSPYRSLRRRSKDSYIRGPRDARKDQAIQQTQGNIVGFAEEGRPNAPPSSLKGDAAEPQGPYEY